MNIFRIFLIVLALYAISGAQILTDFEQDSLANWRSEGDGRYYLEANTGNPGNCMRVDDDATGATNLAIAPVVYLGDWSAADSTDSLMTDVYVSLINGTFVPDLWAFRISGPGGSATGPPVNPTIGQWDHIAVALDSAQWTQNSGTWQELLNHVTSLEVRAEYINGDEFVLLDNIGLTFSPVVVPVAAPVLTDFEQGLYEGWSFEETGGTSIPSSGGNPGRYLRISDGTGTSQALAPPKFLGDWSGIDGAAAILFDLQVSNISGPLYLHPFWLKISGPGGVARIPVDSTVTGAFNRWQTFSFLIDEKAWMLDSGDWDALISDVRELRMAVEFISGSEIVWLDNFRISDAAPLAGFAADPVYVFLGDSVSFTDQSRNAPDSWIWDFGDGSSSTERDPVHLYQTPGKYDVGLTVVNYFGSDMIEKSAFIEVAGITDSILFFDDFDDNTIHPAWQFRNGTWVEQGQTMSQTSNYYNGSYIGGAYALVGSRQWKNYQIDVDLRSTDNDKIGVVFNYQDEGNFYLFTWQLEGTLRAVKKFVNGAMTDIISDTVGYTGSQWYHLTVVTENGNITVEIDSVEIFSASDTTFKEGRAGLYCHGNQSSFWDNFQVRNLDFVNAIPDNRSALRPSAFNLLQNYPNPFNPETVIRWQLAVGSQVDLSVYNLLGRKVATLVSQHMQPGAYTVTFNGRNLASGVYYYVLHAGSYHAIRKMTLLK